MIKKIVFVVLFFIVLLGAIFDIFFRTIRVKLDEPVVMKSWQIARFDDLDLEIRISKFINSPCPSGAQCIWSGQAVTYEYRMGKNIIMESSLREKYGYQVRTIESDYKSYAKLVFSKNNN